MSTSNTSYTSAMTALTGPVALELIVADSVSSAPGLNEDLRLTISHQEGCVTVEVPTLTLVEEYVATVSLSSAESEAKAITEGCVEAFCVKHLLEHQTARTFKIEVWTDSHVCQGHDTTSWTRAQSKALGGADDVGSTVEQGRSHLDEQAGYAGDCGRHGDKTRATSSTRQVGRIGHTFFGEEHSFRRIRLCGQDDSSHDSRFEAGVLRGRSCDEQIHTDHRDLLSYVTINWERVW